jgi:hypothetical protein
MESILPSIQKPRLEYYKSIIIIIIIIIIYKSLVLAFLITEYTVSCTSLSN